MLEFLNSTGWTKIILRCLSVNFSEDLEDAYPCGREQCDSQWLLHPGPVMDGKGKKKIKFLDSLWWTIIWVFLPWKEGVELWPFFQCLRPFHTKASNQRALKNNPSFFCIVLILLHYPISAVQKQCALDSTSDRLAVSPFLAFSNSWRCRLPSSHLASSLHRNSNLVERWKAESQATRRHPSHHSFHWFMIASWLQSQSEHLICGTLPKFVLLFFRCVLDLCLSLPWG